MEKEKRVKCKGPSWLPTEEQKKDKDFVFRYMYLTLGYYATKYNYDDKNAVCHPTLGERVNGILHDGGARAKEALELVKKSGHKPEDCN